MYFFYLDESGTRDPSVGTTQKPKEHLYVLLAVGMPEEQWQPFETEVSCLKLGLIDRLGRDGEGKFDLIDCEVKSNWLRAQEFRIKRSPFLMALQEHELARITRTFFSQVASRNTIIMASVVDKRFLGDDITGEEAHVKAYELLLESVQCYMDRNHPEQGALIVMDDMSKKLNQTMALKHADLQHFGNTNMVFPSIAEGPFFVRSELSNGVQLADLLAYAVYRAIGHKELDYQYFAKILPNFYQEWNNGKPDGLKVWPNESPLLSVAKSLFKK